jgi:TetR/AcrR family transcriptional repressor of nem operon
VPRSWTNIGRKDPARFSLSWSTPRIRRGLRRYFTAAAERADACGYSAGCLVGNLSGELAGQDTLIVGHLAAVLDAWTKAIEDCLLEARAPGQLRCDRDPVARLLVNALQGAILRTKVDKSGTALTDLEAFGGATVLV